MPAPVAVTLLGPVGVTVAGQPVELAPFARAVLARLALDAGAVVSTERLIDALWAANPPHTARKRVHVTVCCIRHRLRDRGAGTLIATRPPGYLLAAADADIDVVRLRAALAEARRTITNGDDSAAECRLAGALASWSAEPLGGVRAPFAADARAHLDELRLHAVEELAQLRLRVRPAAELVPELTALAAANPLRERIRGCLMISLKRAGRQAEALSAYRSYARFLDEHYGLRPGVELQQVRDAVLRAADV